MHSVGSARRSRRRARQSSQARGSIRLFLGIPLEAEARDALAAFLAPLSKRFDLIRWTRPDNLHVTMRFFGDIAETEIPKIIEDTSRIITEHPRVDPFGSLALGKAGMFPHRDRVIFWAGLRNSDWITRLGQTLSSEQRPFKPHVTLGRYINRRDGTISMNDLLSTLAKLPAIEQPKCRLVLYESQTLADGAVYKELQSWP